MSLHPKFGPNPQMSIGELQHMIGTWADKAFPDRTVHSSLSKLVLEEIPEFLLAKGDDADEYADLVILILDVAHQKNIDVASAVLRKHQRNTERSWAKDPTTGAYHHVGRSVDPACRQCGYVHPPDLDCQKEDVDDYGGRGEGVLP